MSTLVELNSFSDGIINFNDVRPSDVRFSFPTARDVEVDITTQSFTLQRRIDIIEIVQPSQAQVQFIVDVSSVVGTTVNFGTLPAGVSVSASGGVYTVNGIDSVSDWEAVRAPTITLLTADPLGTFTYDCEIRYVNNGVAKSKSWQVGNNYLLATFGGVFGLTATFTNVQKETTANLLANTTLSANGEFVIRAVFSVLCNAKATYSDEFTLNASSSILCTPNKLHGWQSYTVYEGEYGNANLGKNFGLVESFPVNTSTPILYSSAAILATVNHTNIPSNPYLGKWVNFDGGTDSNPYWGSRLDDSNGNVITSWNLYQGIPKASGIWSGILSTRSDNSNNFLQIAKIQSSTGTSPYVLRTDSPPSQKGFPLNSSLGSDINDSYSFYKEQHSWSLFNNPDLTIDTDDQIAYACLISSNQSAIYLFDIEQDSFDYATLEYTKSVSGVSDWQTVDVNEDYFAAGRYSTTDTSSTDTTLYVWNTSDGSLAYSITPSSTYRAIGGTRIRQIKIKGNELAIAGFGVSEIYDLTTGTLVQTISSGGPNFDFNDNYTVHGGSNTVRVYRRADTSSVYKTISNPNVETSQTTDFFGDEVGILSDNRIIASAYAEDPNGDNGAGVIYEFTGD